MTSSLSKEGALALAILAFTNARGALVNVDAAPHEKRMALEAPLAVPSTRDLARQVGTRNLAAVVSAAAARPYPSLISRQLRQHFRALACGSHVSGGAWRSPADGCARKSAYFRQPGLGGAEKPLLGIRGYVDSKSAPLSVPRLVAGPIIQNYDSGALERCRRV